MGDRDRREPTLGKRGPPFFDQVSHYICLRHDTLHLPVKLLEGLDASAAAGEGWQRQGRF
jgi:hypothetical protein